MADDIASIPRPNTTPMAGQPGPPSPVVSPIIGRDHEIAEVRALLDSDSVHLLSLLGPGGVGKTRLAQEVVRQAGSDFAHGAVVVSLAPVRTADVVPFAVAQALAVQERGEGSLLELLSEWLHPRHMLLVLDNMEHVVDAAYPWLASLIATSPRLKVLVTSRIALNITGEQRFHVKPLPLPADGATERLDENASVALFAQRARQVRTDFTLDGDTGHAVARICRRVDGLPLAIELAASRVNAFTPADILSQISESLASLAGTRRDAPPRQRSLRDAIAWSYGLLPPDEQHLFRNLAVFVGGFSLEAANAIATDSSNPPATQAVADLIATLVDHSLIERVETSERTRFRMLETIREFGIAQLAERDELTAARDRHAAYYRHLAEIAATGLEGPDQAAWLQLLDAEHGNLREAIDWLTASDNVTAAIELYTHIEHAWLVRSHFTEIRQLLDEWSAHPDMARRTRARALLLAAGAVLANYLELPGSPVPAYTEALGIFLELGDRRNVMRMLGYLAFNHCLAGDRERAAAANEEHLALARELGDARQEAVAFDVRALLAMHDGDTRRAQAAIETSLAIARNAGDLCQIALATDRLGELILRADHDIDRARALLDEARTIRERLGDTRNLPFAYMVLAEIERASGNLDLARTWLLAAQPHFQHTGLALGEADINRELARLSLLQGDPASALQGIRRSLTERLRFEDEAAAAEDMILLAELALATGDPCSGTRFLGAVEALSRRSPAVLGTPATGSVQSVTARVRAALDPETFEHHHAVGMAWSLEDAVTAALAFDPVLEPAAPRGTEERPHGLSPREIEVLRLMTDGLSNREIADTLFLSLRTVTSHVSAILGKLDLTSRTQAVAWAIRNDVA